jgi:hypothetical protein
MKSCPEVVRVAILESLRTSLLRVRSAAGAGDAPLCFIEADHVHNLPALLVNYSEDTLRFYLDVERPSYLDQLRRHASGGNHHRDVRALEPYWESLDRCAGVDSVPARNAG